MFKPVQMYEVNLFIMNQDLEKTTEIIYDLKLMEFFKIEIDKFNKFNNTTYQDLTHKLLEVRSIITILKKFYSSPIKSDKNYSIKEILDIKKEYDETFKEIDYFSSI